MDRDPRVLEVCEEIRLLMRERGLTQVELERAAGLSPKYLSQVLNGYVEFRLNHLLDLAAGLDIAASEILARAAARNDPDDEILPGGMRLSVLRDVFRRLRAEEEDARNPKKPRS